MVMVMVLVIWGSLSGLRAYKEIQVCGFAFFLVLTEFCLFDNTVLTFCLYCCMSSQSSTFFLFLFFRSISRSLVDN